jgi:activator of HSP90 ATPase
MTKTIHLAAALPAPPERLFDMYLDPVEHAAFTGAAVVISSTPGSEFRAFNGVLTGTMLHVVPKRLIVQAWRSPHWTAADLDSTLILTFLPEGNGARIELVQVNVVENDFAGVCHGWEKFYWTPWREYLASKS